MVTSSDAFVPNIFGKTLHQDLLAIMFPTYQLICGFWNLLLHHPANYFQGKVTYPKLSRIALMFGCE